MTREQQLLSALAKTIFRLNGQLLWVGEELARPAGLTSSLWQVLGAVLSAPRSVAEVAREIGVTRQSVQRVADTLVARKLASYKPNPAHRRAQLLTPTDAGREAIRRIAPAHAAFADRLAVESSVESLTATLASVERLSRALETVGGSRRVLRKAG